MPAAWTERVVQSLWMVLASVLFACMGVCVKLGAQWFSVGEMVFFRGAIAMAMAAGIAALQGVPLQTQHWRLQASRAGAGSLALLCYFFALGILPLATAVTLNYTSPIFVAVLLALLLGERLHWPVLASVLLGFVGVVLLLQPTLGPDQWLGAAAGLGSGLIASFAYISVRELGRAGEPEVRTVFWFSATTALLGLPWVTGSAIATTGPAGWGVLAGIGLFGGAAQFAMTRAYQRGKTIVSANLAYTTVIFSSLFGVWIWGETLPLEAWLAIGLIIASGVAVSVATRGTAATPGQRLPTRHGD